jgi:hypothetical protein
LENKQFDEELLWEDTIFGDYLRSIYCMFSAFCPVPQQESVSTCQVTCNPKEDGENSDGQICCPNSCGGENGGVYMDPLSYYGKV